MKSADIVSKQREMIRAEKAFERFQREQEKRQDSTIRDMETQHHEEIEMLTKLHKKEKSQIEEAYKIDISHTAEKLKNELDLVRKAHKSQIESSVEENEKEFALIRERENKRLENYRKNQEEILRQVQEEFSDAREQQLISNADLED